MPGWSVIAQLSPLVPGDDCCPSLMIHPIICVLSCMPTVITRLAGPFLLFASTSARSLPVFYSIEYGRSSKRSNFIQCFLACHRCQESLVKAGHVWNWSWEHHARVCRFDRFCENRWSYIEHKASVLHQCCRSSSIENASQQWGPRFKN